MNNELAKELDFKPHRNDCTFYPDITDLKNHVYKAKRALELSTIDQEKLRLKVNEWAADNSEKKFCYILILRPAMPQEWRCLMYK